MLLLAVNIGLYQSVVASAIRSLQDSLYFVSLVSQAQRGRATHRSAVLHSSPCTYLTGEYGLWRSMGWAVALGAGQYFILFCLALLYGKHFNIQSNSQRNGQFLSLSHSRSRPKMIFQEWAFLSKLFFKSKPAIMNKIFLMTSHLVPAILLGVF